VIFKGPFQPKPSYDPVTTPGHKGSVLNTYIVEELGQPLFNRSNAIMSQPMLTGPSCLQAPSLHTVQPANKNLPSPLTVT